MKDVVPEELEHVPVPVLRPAKVTVQLRPVHHRRQLRQAAEQPRRFYLLRQLALQRVVAPVRRVELLKRAQVVNSDQKSQVKPNLKHVA